MVEMSYLGKKFKFEEYKSGNPMRRLRSGRFYEKQMLDYIRQQNPEGVIIDVGANIGNHTVYLAALTDCDKVMAFEPQPTVYKTLMKNIRNNKLDKKVEVHHVALGDKPGKVGLFWEAPDQLGGTRVVEGDTTEQTTLDNVVKNKKVSVIKIDVEGYEVNVLKGAKKLLAKQSPLLFVEVWSRKAKKEVDEVLSPLGYSPVKVFNSSATYLYQKDAQRKPGIKGAHEELRYQLSRHRVFRRTS